MKEAKLEMTSGVVRVYSGDSEHGEPYEWSCSAVRVAHDEVEFLGACRPLTPSVYRALYRLCQASGIRCVWVTRWQDGMALQRCISIDKYRML